MGRKCNSTLSSRIASFSLSLFVSLHSLRQFDLRQESHHEARADKWDIISQLPSICGPCVLQFFREHKLVSSPGLRLPSSRCRLLCRRPPTTTIRSDQIFFCCPPSSILHPFLPSSPTQYRVRDWPPARGLPLHWRSHKWQTESATVGIVKSVELVGGVE